MRVLTGAGWEATGDRPVSKTVFLRQFYLKTIVLPRQARDKHRENSKRDRFSSGRCVLSPAFGLKKQIGRRKQKRKEKKRKEKHCVFMLCLLVDLQERSFANDVLSFPYVCPEPVLVKRSFLYKTQTSES